MVKIPITHLIIYGEIKRKGNGAKIISIHDIRPIIKWRIRIPVKYHFEVIKEMCYFGLLKKLSRDDYEIIECNKLTYLAVRDGDIYQYQGKPPVDSLGEPFW